MKNGFVYARNAVLTVRILLGNKYKYLIDENDLLKIASFYSTYWL